MRILLLAMPDVASSFDRVMQIPNLGIASLAANIDEGEVKILDLVLHGRVVGRAVRQALADFKPDLVGLSAMTFQYDTARQIAALVRSALPEVYLVLGGFHATLAYEEIAADPRAEVFDFLVRGEGEQTLNLLVQALARKGGWENIPGLSYRALGASGRQANSGFVHNPRGPLLDLAEVRLPNREARLAQAFTYFGRPFDVVETSRGCTHNCRFCSIHQMYGATYRVYPLERVLADIREAADRGAQGIFFVDDNINLDSDRFQQLCEGIIEADLQGLEFITQADVGGFVRAPHLPAIMYRVGFRAVFLGIESVERENWRFLRKSNSFERAQGVIGNLRAHGIGVAGGFILGNPEDDAESIRAAFHTARALKVDHAIMWCLTPYPGTEIRRELLAEGLVTNPSDYRWYNGYICDVRTRRLARRQLVRLIAAEGLKLYFHPGFLFNGRIWGRRPGSVLPFLQSSLEYLTRGYRNRLFASRHRM